MPAPLTSDARGRLTELLGGAFADAVLDVLRGEQEAMTANFVVAALADPAAPREIRAALARLDSENSWLTKSEAMAEARFGDDQERSFRRWCQKWSVLKSESKGPGEPLFQLASLQRAMRMNAAPCTKGKLPVAAAKAPGFRSKTTKPKQLAFA